MATFTPGGGTLKSTTMEQAIIELCERTQELDTALPTPTGNVGLVYNADGNLATIGLNLPVERSIVSGKLTYTATDWLTGHAFAPGTSGTLTSDTYPGALLELATDIQVLEVAQDKNNLNITIDDDAGIATVIASIPVAYSIDASNGTTVVTADAYLS